jgi:hypothetical protein
MVTARTVDVTRTSLNLTRAPHVTRAPLKVVTQPPLVHVTAPPPLNLHTIHTFVDKPVAPQSPTTNPSHFISRKLNVRHSSSFSLSLSEKSFLHDGRLELEDMTQT